MPKVSDYELEHLDDEVQETVQKIKKKKKQVKEKKYPEKRDVRAEWKRNQQSLEEETNQNFDDEDY